MDPKTPRQVVSDSVLHPVTRRARFLAANNASSQVPDPYSELLLEASTPKPLRKIKSVERVKKTQGSAARSASKNVILHEYTKISSILFRDLNLLGIHELQKIIKKQIKIRQFTEVHFIKLHLR